MNIEEFLSQLKIHRKRINKGIFGALLVCFFMPFLTLSCQSQDLMTFNGIQLGTGTTMTQPNLYGSGQTRQIPAEPLATLAIAAAGAGLATSFLLKHRKELIGSTAAGAVGTIVLLALKSKIDNDVIQQGQGMIRARYELGFWLAFLLFIATAGLNGWELKSSQNNKSINKNQEWITAKPLNSEAQEKTGKPDV